MANFKLSNNDLAKYIAALSKTAENMDDTTRRCIYPAAKLVADEIDQSFMTRIVAPQEYQGRRTGPDVPPHKNMTYIPTGEMREAFGISKMDRNKSGTGWNVHIGWSGYHQLPSGGDNPDRSFQEVANALESGYERLRPRPFVKPAVNGKTESARQAMQRMFEQILKKQMG